MGEDAATWLNHYACTSCRVRWDDAWECQCNDECPECGAETTPYASTDLETGEMESHVGPGLDAVDTFLHEHRIIKEHRISRRE